MADTAEVLRSVDNAAALIAGMRQPPEPASPAAPTDDAPAQEAEQQAEPEAEAQADAEVDATAGTDELAEAEPEASEQPAEAADADDQTSAPEQEVEADAADDAMPTVDAPTGWSDAQRAEFAKMPVEAQRIVATREAERDTDFQSKTTELGERSKQLDEAVELAQNSSLGQLQQAQALMANAMEAAGFHQEPNWAELHATLDPDDYRDMRDQWDITAGRMAKFQQEFSQVSGQIQQQQQKVLSDDIQSNNKRTAAKYPKYADAKTRDAFTEEMYTFLDSKGIGRDQSTHLFVTEWVNVVQDAMELSRLKDAKPQIAKKLRDAPKMARAGTPKTKERGRVENVRAALQQAGNSKNPSDLAGVFAALRQ